MFIAVVIGIAVGLVALIMFGLLMMRSKHLREVLAMPAVWLTAIILFGFIIAPGAMDVEGVRSGSLGFADTGKMARVATVLIAAVMSMFVIVRANALRYLFTGNVGILTAYAVFAIISVAFSELKTMTLFKSVEILVGCMIAATLYAHKNRFDSNKNYLTWLFWVYFLTIVGVYVQFGIFGAEGQRQVVGETPLIGFSLVSRYPGMRSNALGYLGAIVTLFGVHVAMTREEGGRRRRILGTLLAVLGFGVVFLSYTRSALAFLVLALLIYLVFRKKYLAVIIGVLMMIVSMAIPDVRTKLVDHLRRGMSETQIETLSGRTTMWERVLERDALTLMVGTGFATGALFQDYADNPFHRGRILEQRNVHNSVFEVIMSIGIMGAALWLWLMSRIFMQLMQHRARTGNRAPPAERIWHMLLIAMFVLSFLRSMMNSTFVYMDYFYPVLLGYAVYADSLKARRKELLNSKTEPPSAKPA